MNVRIPHHTTRDAARRKIESMLDQLAADYASMVQELEHHWRGDLLQFAFRAKGLKIGGNVEVTDDEVLLHGKLPLLALAFEPKIRHMIEHEAAKVFPPKSGKSKSA